MVIDLFNKKYVTILSCRFYIFTISTRMNTHFFNKWKLRNFFTRLEKQQQIVNCENLFYVASILKLSSKSRITLNI